MKHDYQDKMQRAASAKERAELRRRMRDSKKPAGKDSEDLPKRKQRYLQK